MKFHRHLIEVIIHIVVWLCIFSSPLLFHRQGDSFDFHHFLCGLILPLTMCVAFYANYLWLIPRYYLKRRYTCFILLNVLLAIGCVALVTGTMHIFFAHDPHHPKHGPNGPLSTHHLQEIPRRKPITPRYLFLIRDGVIILFTSAVALAVRLAIAWHVMELQRHRLQHKEADAALRNLKSQFSPHFLLNTLNAIYSLTAFDPDKAQTAILELARLLRYQLYESDHKRVPLQKEAEFLNHYIALMQLRLGDTVEVTQDIHIVPEDSSIVIAPHVLICLVENAFKHGVCAKDKSFVHISLEADLERIHFVCTNSNHPKPAGDHTPGGIGLQQVAQRLNLVYPNTHTWSHGPSADGKTYTSDVTIYNIAHDTELLHH